MRAIGLLLMHVSVGAMFIGAASESLAQEVTRIRAEKSRLEVLREVQISTEVTGTLVEVNPQSAGAFVRKGDLLIRVNDRLIQAELATAEKRADTNVEIDFAQKSIESAEHRLNEMQEANQKVAGSRAESGRRSTDLYTPNEIRTTKLELDKAVAQLAKANEDKVIFGLTAEEKRAILSQYEVRAPFDGIVTTVHKFPAQNSRPGDPVLTLTDLSILRAIVEVNFVYRQQLFVGDEVEFRIDTGAKPQAQARSQTDDGASSEVDVDGIFGSPGPNAEPAAMNPFELRVEPSSQDDQDVFLGTIVFIDPRIETISGGAQDAYAVKLTVDLPNPRDRHGRYVLQEGLPVKATVLAKPRPE